MTTRRFVERQDAKRFIKESKDFNVRRAKIPLMRIIAIFVSVLMISFVFLVKLIYSLLFLPSHVSPGDELGVILSLVLFAAMAVGAFAVYLIYSIRQNLIATEFQNLIFASSMRVKTDFCLIVHREKTGIYCDYDFDEMFEQYEYHSNDPFHMLMASQGFNDADEKRLEQALAEGKEAEFDFNLKKKDGTVQKMHVTLDPIERPKGFYIIKGFKKAS